MTFVDIIDYSFELFTFSSVDHIRVVCADHPLVGGDDHYIQVIDLRELYSLGVGSAGHTTELLIHAKVVLNRNSGKGLVFVTNLYFFFGLNCLMQTVRPAPARHEASSEFIDNDDFSTRDYVVYITLEQAMGSESLGKVVKRINFCWVVKIIDP